MVSSINTNAGSLLGVRSLQKSSSALASSQRELSTGLKVSSAKDNAAFFSISQILKSDIAGLNSVKTSINAAISSSDVALSAGSSVSDLLLDLKETAVKAADPGLDDASRLLLNDQFVALRDQISTVVENAEFGGRNTVKSGGDDIVALVGADGDSNITIDAQDLSLGGGNVTLAAGDDVRTLADAEAAVIAIDESLGNVSAALSEIGSGAQQLEQTKEFTEVLQAKTQEGLGNLVDADLAKTSAQFEADKVKQALGILSLSISNKSTSSVLALFQDK
ncbi:MAG: flagellin [Kordiimonadaceae bacterium]|nr:flagellin [Kordiimonadaceae bacterium]